MYRRKTRTWPSRGGMLPEIKMSHLNFFLISSMSSGNNGLFVMGLANKIPCSMNNVTIIRIFSIFGRNTYLDATLHCTTTGDKTQVHVKVQLNIKLENATYRHLTYM